jgi:hypothetical protein
MNYRELLERYKEGLVSDEEKQSIEKDIEKYEAIEEYLSENIDIDLNSLSTIREGVEHKEETIKIKRSVNSRLRRVVYMSAAIVLGILIGIFYVISPLVEGYYYNPAKTTVGKDSSDINFDLYALTELNMPGNSLTSDVYIDKQGFGKYDIGFFRTNLFTLEQNYVTTTIKRGERLRNYTEVIDGINSNYFTDVKYPVVNSEQISKKKQRVMEHIMQLNPVSYLSANLTFEKDLTMEELRKLEVKYPDIDFIWAGIRTAPNDKRIPHLFGINLIKSNTIITKEENVEEKYPAFHILEWLVNPRGIEGSDISIEAKAYELHYKSLLQYMIDRKEAVKVLESNPMKMEYYKSALDYAEANGTKTFGVLVYADSKDLIKLVENESIKLVELNQVLASKAHIK